MKQRTYPDRRTALEIWKQGINYRHAHDGWPKRFETEYRFHSLGIAYACAKVAALIPGMDPEKAWVLGLLHDYGKRHDERKGEHFHVLDGYNEMLRLGYTDVARICLSHSFPKKDFDFSAYGCCREWLAAAREKLDTVELDDYDRLVQLFDFMFEGLRITTFENRVKGIVSRYHPKTPPTDLYNHALENKAYFEAKIGQDIYALLNVRENLPELPTPTEAEILFEVIISIRNMTTYPFTPLQESTFRAHCQAVAAIARKLAGFIPDMDPDKAYALGLLHDCGRQRDEINEKAFHAVTGYDYMMTLGFPQIARISVTHCFFEKEFCCQNYPQPPEQLSFCRELLSTVEYDNYDRLIQMADMLNVGGCPCTLEQRFQDIAKRYQVPYHQMDTERLVLEQIKQKFDNLCGQDIYKLIGEQNEFSD